jgi:hypothetical protein
MNNDTIIVKHNGKENNIIYNSNNIVIHNNKKYYYLGENIVIKELSKRTKVIELTDIVTSNQKYIPLNCYYDILKLYNSHFYKFINKLLLNDTKFMKNKKLGYYGIKIKQNVLNTINFELKKIDKAFIETGIRNTDNKIYYCVLKNTNLSNICNFTTLYKSISSAKKCKGTVYKVVLNEGLPYFNINRNIILLPRNILFELITDNTFLAKEKIHSKPLYHITADLYNFKTSVKGGTPYSRVRLGEREGINGIITYDIMKINSDIDLKVIMTNGEYHGLQTNCNKNYITEYVKIFKLNEKEPKYNFKIDLFLEVENYHKSIDNIDTYLSDKSWLEYLIKHLKKNWSCHDDLQCKYNKYLRVHWVDPWYDLGEGYEWLTTIGEDYTHYYYYDENKKYEDLTIDKLKAKYPTIFAHIKSKDDLIKIILENRLIRKQGEKVNKKIIPDWEQFIKDAYYNDLKFSLNITNDNWYTHGICETNRVCMDFYTIFRMFRDPLIHTTGKEPLIIKNAIYHSGELHTLWFTIILKKLKLKIESLDFKNLKYADVDSKCLDANFNGFLDTILQVEKEEEDIINTELETLKQKLDLEISKLSNILNPSDLSKLSGLLESSNISSSLSPSGLSELSDRSSLSSSLSPVGHSGILYILDVLTLKKNERFIIIKEKLQEIIKKDLMFKKYNKETLKTKEIKLKIIEDLKTLIPLNSREIRRLNRIIKL